MRGKPLVNLLLALVIAVLAGAGASLLMTQRAEDRVTEHAAEGAALIANPRDRVRRAIAGLRADQVHVTPDARTMVDEEGERALEVAVGNLQTDAPVHILVWRETRSAGASRNTLLDQVEAEFADERAVLVVWAGPQTGDVIVTGEGNGDVDFDSYDFLGDPTTTLLENMGAMAEVEWRGENDFDYWGGPLAGFLAGVLFSVLGLLAIAMLYGIMIISCGGKRLPGGWT